MGGLSSRGSGTGKDSGSKIKMLLLGMPGVGKTSIISIYQDPNFNEHQEPTTGCNLINLMVPLHGRLLQMLVMDSLADVDLGLSCRLKAIQNAEILAIIFDLTILETWRNVADKIRIVKENNYQHRHLILIGNKCDEEAVVRREEVEEFIRSDKDLRIEYFQCSAKARENVCESIQRALELGYTSSKHRWDKIKILLFLFRYAQIDQDIAGFSWGNLCEAIPSLIKTRKTRAIALNLLPTEVLKRLISFI